MLRSAALLCRAAYQPGALVEVRYVWWLWQQVTNCPDCWGIEGEIPPPTVTLRVLLADVQAKPIYDAAVAAEDAAWEDAQAAAAASSASSFMAMAVDEGGGGMMLMDTQVIFTALDSFVTVTPAQANAATQLVQVAGSTSGTNIQSSSFLVRGFGAQHSYTNTTAIVDVDVLPKGTNVTVAIYAVTSTGEPSTTPTNVPTQAQLKAYLDTVFGKQANVFINVLPLVSTNLSYDLNMNTNMDLASGNFLSDEMKAVTNAGYRSGAFNVYYVHAINPAVNGIAFGVPLNTIFIRDNHAQSAVNLTAHEIGHLFNPIIIKDVPTGIWGDVDRLMWYSDLSSDPCRLVRYEWTEINKRAQ
jgi:hypothetical protein